MDAQQMMKPDRAHIIFPHQLFEDISTIHKNATVYLVEEWLFFRQYKFHKQKIAFHRASMKFYERYLSEQGFTVNYIDAFDECADIRILIKKIASHNIRHVSYSDTTDNWLENRLTVACSKHNIDIIKYPSQLFVNTKSDISNYFPGKQRYFQTDFYKQQRANKKILVDKNKNPVGEKWSFDEDNRKKYPKNKIPPTTHFPDQNKFYTEAIKYTEKYFPDNYGQLNDAVQYPCTYKDCRLWLDQFLENRFAEFGLYEDAIVSNEHFLHHSLLSPLLNVGLLTPATVIEKSISFASEHNVPINSLEGFIRQILGWREFVRGVYEEKGVQQRTTNFWKFTRRIPASFRDGTTGILPIDTVIHKILKTGYCHHIERLMALGNFMLLCEFDPDEVYRWFMEMFIDAYDWVMVPNVYGMSQFADGVLMSTKPYISGSNYLLKMSDFKKGPWQEIWDALFWQFIEKNKAFFSANYRLAMLVSSLDKMPCEKKKRHFAVASEFLQKLRSMA